MIVFKTPVRIGKVVSYNMADFAEYVDDDGYLKDVNHTRKLVPLYNGEIVPKMEVQDRIGLTESQLRRRLHAAGLFKTNTDQHLIFLDDEILKEFKDTEIVEPLEKQQPCWSCQNYATCAWARKAKPIEGWKAEPTMVEMNKRPVPSFEIKNCPNYAEDLNIAELFRFDPSYGKMEHYKTHSSEKKLWRSVLKRTLRDYANALIAQQDESYHGKFMHVQRKSGFTGDPDYVAKECKEFLLSEYFDLILSALGITTVSGQDFVNVVQNDPDKFRYNFCTDTDDIYEEEA